MLIAMYPEPTTLPRWIPQWYWYFVDRDLELYTNPRSLFGGQWVGEFQSFLVELFWDSTKQSSLKRMLCLFNIPH